MCYVACGKLDGFWELNLNAYDIAAGRLILEEAGGKYTDFGGGVENVYVQNLATNGKIHLQLADLLGEFADYCLG